MELLLRTDPEDRLDDTSVLTKTAQSCFLILRTDSVGSDAITNGNEHEIASYQGVSYTYVNDTSLSQVTYVGYTYELAYDALGRRALRVNNVTTTTYYIYDGEKPIQEIGPVWASTIYGIGIDEPVIRFTSSDVYYFYQDHEGSVTHVRNNPGGGTWVERYRYDAFGKPTIMDANWNVRTQSAIGNRFMFTGREWAPMNLGFYEYRASAYHPGVGRFMSEDPKLFDAGDYNLFRYCHNDPEDLTDPMGLDSLPGGPYPSLGYFQRIAMLEQIRNLKELVGAGGAIATGQANFAIEKLSQALGGATKEKIDKASPQAMTRILGGTAQQREEMGTAVSDVLEKSERGKEATELIKAAGKPLLVNINKPGVKYTWTPKAGGFQMNVSPDFPYLAHTTAGDIPFTLTRQISHEVGHAVFGFGADRESENRTVNEVENPIMFDLGEPLRTRY